MTIPVEYIVQAVEYVESGGHSRAVSKSGCIGLMQVCPQWAHVPREQLFIPEINRKEGTRILMFWNRKARGDWWATLAGYRCGWGGLKGLCGKGYANKVMSLARKLRDKTPGGES